ncbi:sulfite exporter TauE/SafE family protein [Azospirillum sp. sgz301742]
MSFLDSINPLYSVSGFVVGVLVGLTGVGGGSLMTPLLMLVFGINPATAVGTDLLYASITKAGGTVVHSLNGTVDWPVTAWLAAGSVPATVLTLAILHQFGINAEGTSRLVSAVLGVTLVLTALSLLLRRTIQDYAHHHQQNRSRRRTAVLTALGGAVLGVLVSLSSIGAGAIGITMLLLLYPNLPTARIVGSDIAHAVLLTLIAGVGHWMLGSVSWPLLVSLLLGSLPGIGIGSLASARVPDRVLRPILATTLAAVAGKLLIAM